MGISNVDIRHAACRPVSRRRSVHMLVENVKICTSLVQLCKKAPPGIIPLTGSPDVNNNNTSSSNSSGSSSSRNHSTPSKLYRSASACREGGAAHREGGASERSGCRRRSSSVSKLEYGAFARDIAAVVGDGDKPAAPTTAARAILQDRPRNAAEKTLSICCGGGSRVGVRAKENAPLLAAGCPDAHYICDKLTGTAYVKGRLLGKGGFAKCYELTDVRTHKLYAGKIISKNRLSKPHQKEKIIREIDLHKDLKHGHVVGFHSYFEDDDNVYIILELCRRKSLMHVVRNRKAVTEAEVRYYVSQMVDGCRYLRERRIVHRDLKLGNMLLNDNMQVKIADFGLATRLQYDGQKKMTVCGTPNYIAPEVLQKKGHSYEADTWAIGCIMYAMLVGRPPFETATLKETYQRITANRFSFPAHVSPAARGLIGRLLRPDPADRPGLDGIMADEFFTAGYVPKALPASCCDVPPKFSVNRLLPRPKSYAAPITAVEAIQKISSFVHMKGSRKSVSQILTKTAMSQKDSDALKTNGMSPLRSASSESKVGHLSSSVGLYQMLSSCLDLSPADADPTPVVSSRPLWVTKWVDYSNKYGFGFQLADKSVGVLFNDSTRMLLAPYGRTVQYNDLSNRVYVFSTDAPPKDYKKKVTLLLYFAQYMDEHLIHGGDMLHAAPREGGGDGAAWAPTGIFMKKWFRTDRGIVMYLNNGTLQVNFFEDHTKIIVSAETHDYLVTYINSQRQAVSYSLLQIRHFGCKANIIERLQYGRRVLEKIINVAGETV